MCNLAFIVNRSGSRAHQTHTYILELRQRGTNCDQTWRFGKSISEASLLALNLSEMGGLCCHHSSPFESAKGQGQSGYVDGQGHSLGQGQAYGQGHRQGQGQVQEYTLSGPLKPPDSESTSVPTISVPAHPRMSRGGSMDQEDFSFNTQENEQDHSMKTVGGRPSEMWRVHHGSVDMEDFSEDFGEGSEKGGRRKLSRVLSSRVKTARSRTTFVAKKGAAKVLPITNFCRERSFDSYELRR